MSDAAMEAFLRMGEEIPGEEEDKKREAVKEFQDYPEYVKVPRAALFGAMQGATLGYADELGDFVGKLGARGEGELSTSEKDLLAKTESPYAHLTGEVIGALLGLRGAGTLPLAKRLAVEGGLGAAERVGKGGLSLENLLKGFAWGVVPGGTVEGVKRGIKAVGGKAFARRGGEAAEELAQESLKKEKAIAEATEEASALRSAKEAEEQMLRSQASEKASELLDPANVTRMTAQQKLKAANDLAERYAAIARMAPEKAALEEAKIAMRQADEMLAALQALRAPNEAVSQAVKAAKQAKNRAARATKEALSSTLPAEEKLAREARRLAAGERAAVPPVQPNYAEVAREMSKASATKTRTAAEEALQPLMRPVKQAEETLRQARAALARLPKTPGSEALREIAYRTNNMEGFTRTYARKLLQSVLKDPAIMSRLSRGEAPKTLKVLEESLRAARGGANDEISPDEAAMMLDLISYIE